MLLLKWHIQNSNSYNILRKYYYKSLGRNYYENVCCIISTLCIIIYIYVIIRNMYTARNVKIHKRNQSAKKKCTNSNSYTTQKIRFTFYSSTCLPVLQNAFSKDVQFQLLPLLFSNSNPKYLDKSRVLRLRNGYVLYYDSYMVIYRVIYFK